MEWIIPGRNAEGNSIASVAANSFSEKAASHHAITSKYGIPMAARVAANCSSPNGMTTLLTTLHPLALTNQLVSE
jgi:hypothetical protein